MFCVLFAQLNISIKGMGVSNITSWVIFRWGGGIRLTGKTIIVLLWSPNAPLAHWAGCRGLPLAVPFESRSTQDKEKSLRPKGLRLFSWLGWRDSNPRMLVPETSALPLGDTPIRVDNYVHVGNNIDVFWYWYRLLFLL